MYFAALQVVVYKTNKAEGQVTAISGSYTNALELKTRLAILKDRQELKYAALDCWKELSDLEPESVTLESFNFRDGQKLTINGTATSDAASDLINLSDSLKKVEVNGQPLFNPAGGDQVPQVRTSGGGLTWSLNLELKRSEARP